MTFDPYVQSVTQDYIVPSVVDGVLTGNILALRFMASGKEWVGESMKRPVMYQKNTSGGSYAGYDTFSVQKVNTRVSLSFDVRSYYQSIVISNIDLSVNATTREKVLDLLKVEMETGMLSMCDSIATLLYSDGTGNSNKDFLGLKAHVDDGTNVATIGTLTRTTYPTALNSSVTSSVGAITHARMAVTYSAVNIGNDAPSLIVTDKTSWDYVEQLLEPAKRAQYAADGYAQVTRRDVRASKSALQGQLGFNAIMFRGAPIVADDKCTAGFMYFLNEKHLAWYGLKHVSHKNINLSKLVVDSSGYKDAPTSFGFSWSGLKEPTNQDAEIGQILVYGNLIGWQGRKQGVISGITS